MLIKWLIFGDKRLSQGYMWQSFSPQLVRLTGGLNVGNALGINDGFAVSLHHGETAIMGRQSVHGLITNTG